MAPLQKLPTAGLKRDPKTLGQALGGLRTGPGSVPSTTTGVWSEGCRASCRQLGGEMWRLNSALGAATGFHRRHPLSLTGYDGAGHLQQRRKEQLRCNFPGLERRMEFSGLGSLTAVLGRSTLSALEELVDHVPRGLPAPLSSQA